MLETKIGNILDAEEEYIIHQCNCVTVEAAGLAFFLFKKYPYANDYARRRFTQKMDTPGTIKIHGDNMKRKVINAFSQFLPGGPNMGNKDSENQRESYFQSCLEEILKIEDLKSIAFPYTIGCGIAGGNWDHYLKMIEEFSKRTPATVVIYQRPEDIRN